MIVRIVIVIVIVGLFFINRFDVGIPTLFYLTVIRIVTVSMIFIVTGIVNIVRIVVKILLI